MRILIAHSRYLSGAASGENRVVEDEHRLLTEAGHSVRVWAPSPTANSMGKIHSGVSAIWSREAISRLTDLIRSDRPEVVHFHNLFPMLSPAALAAAAKLGPAVLVTLHNYRLLCLPATFLRNGKVCEDCLGRVPWRGVVHRCYRNSMLGSGALAASLTLHRGIKTLDRVTLFLAVSRFVRDKHVEAGLPEERIIVKPNFARSSARREGPGDYFLYLGRLSPEKGLDTLVPLWSESFGTLVIVGDGPDEDGLRRAAPRGVEFRAPVDPESVPSLIAGARAVIVPSVSFEGAPRTIIEAYAAGVPVIASRIGGLPEAVREGRSGLLAEPGDESSWIGSIERLLDDRESERLGEGAFELWREHYSPERGLENLEAAYEAAVKAASNKAHN